MRYRSIPVMFLVTQFVKSFDDLHFPKVLTTSATPKSVNLLSLKKVAK
jgi:hypothetical protein